MELDALDRTLRAGIGPKTALPRGFTDLMAFGHRFMGSEGERRARDYLSERLSALGLRVSLQSFDVDSYRRGSARTLLLGNAGPVDLSCLAFAYSPPTSAPLELPLIHAGKGDPEDVEALGDALSGCAAYARPDDVMRSRRGRRLTEHGAHACVFGSHVDHHDGCIVSVVREADGGSVPTVGLNRTATAAVEEALARGPARIRLEVEGETVPATSGNLEAVLPGRSSLPEIVMGAHLDTFDLCEGASDNGAGAALVLETARLFSVLPPPLRTIRFVFFTGEEVFTLGSRRYVAERVADPETVALFFNVDVPAGGGVPGILRTGWSGGEGYWEKTAASLGRRFPVRDVPARFSDHASFANRGIPCLWVQAVHPGTRGPAEFDHTVLDTTDKVDLAELREATDLASRVLLRLANAETLPVSRPATA
jgi:hypothetical protein